MTLSTICEDDVDARFAEIIASEWPKLEGRQTPNSLAFTPGNTELGGKAAELGFRSASRIRAIPWQSWSLEQIMSKGPDGTWTHPECCLIVPRQNGKSLLLSLRVLYGLFKLGEKIVFSAQQWETAKALWKRTWAIVKTTPWMLKRVESHTCSQGRGTIVLASGAEVVFTTRSANAGRGLDRVDLEIYDEAYDLTEADMAALSPTKMNSDDPQTIYTSSAVNQDQHPNGQVLAAVRQRGLDGDEGLFFAEWMAPDSLDRTDPKTWRWANPSFGVIQTDKKLASELRKFSTEAGMKSFDVEYLGRGDWPSELAEVHEPVITAEAWSDMEGRSELTGPIAIAVDRHLDWYSIAMAQRTTTGKIHIEIGYLDRPSTGVVETIAAIVESVDPCVVMMNRTSPATSLNPALKLKRIEPVLTSGQEMGQACVGFLDDALAGQLEHTNDPRLNNSIDGVKKKPMSGGAFGWDYDTAVLLAPLVAATLARLGLLTHGVEEPKPEALPPAYEAATGPAEFDALSAAF
ncbi:hypothetical protein L1080_003275 [Rhodococcus sp. MSC1_016]|jgi:hypothetical protein|uniref:hypothetical protein n=1 Tax=Rhodococcus sp. MSC1_016 TaxID=2909266 RepID=UPI00202F8B99|nr:hypothetical protein [Rhodococcus sp. MSC1_016]